MARTIATPADAEFTHYFTVHGAVDFDELKENILYSLPSSFDWDDRWVGREIHVFASNELMSVSISEYCGLVALSVSLNPEHSNLAYRSLEAVRKALKPYSDYQKVATASNGEAFYKRIEAEA